MLISLPTLFTKITDWKLNIVLQANPAIKEKKDVLKKLTDGVESAVGEWNNMVIECMMDKVKVWVNDILVNYGYKLYGT